MTPQQKVRQSERAQQTAQFDLSKLRLAYNEEENLEKRASMEADLLQAEKRFQDAMTAHFTALDELPDPGPIADDDAQAKEFNNLYKRASLMRFVEMVEGKKEFDGVEKEVRQMFMPQGGRYADTIPLAMFLDPNVEMEIRQDTVTVINAATGVKMTMPIAQRVFGGSEAAYMGGRFISVPGGQQDFPFISAGTTATAANENTDIDAGAGVISIVSSNPKEVGARYRWGLTTAYRFTPGEMEAALRQDAVNVINDFIDESYIAGQAATASAPAISGLLSLTYDGRSSSSPTADATALDILRFGTSHVDAIWADTDDNVRYLVPHLMWQAIAYLQLHAMSNLLVKTMLQGRLRASHHITDGAVSSGKRDSDFLTYAPDRDMGEAVIPVWQDVRVTMDNISSEVAQKRQTTLNFDTAYDVVRRRNNPWRRQRLQFAA